MERAPDKRFIVQYYNDKNHTDVIQTTPELTQEELTTFLKGFGNRVLVCIKTSEPIYPITEEACNNGFIVSYKKDDQVMQTKPLNQEQLTEFLKNIKYLVVGIHLSKPIHEVEDSPDVKIIN
jgi:hypothetical protein